MMNSHSKSSAILLSAALFLGASLSALHGQSDTSSNKLPEGPLIAASAPDYAQWDVDCHSAGGEKASGAFRGPHLAHATIIKTGDVQYGKMTYDDGSAKEQWIKGSFLAVNEPGHRGIIIRPRAQQGSDFADFDWVSADNYLGRGHLDAHDCLVFRQAMYPLRFQDPDLYKTVTNGGKSGPSIDLGAKVEVTAWVDLATRLPVQLRIGNELRVYRFGAPPTAPLTLPEAFAKTVTETEKRIQALTRPLATP